MAVTQKLQAIAETDLSGLQARVRELYDEAQRQLDARAATAKAGDGALPALDETWVRKQLLPVLDKISRVKK